MIELLILYVLSEHEMTMYAILKHILDVFGTFTQPSFGAIKPALTRLEKSGFIRSRKAMSDGGKLSGFYSITSDGREELKKLILENLSDKDRDIKLFFSHDFHISGNEIGDTAEFRPEVKGLLHYKGERYKVLNIARHRETLEEYVVYQALYGDGDIWIRPLQMFLDQVPINGQHVPRFIAVE